MLALANGRTQQEIAAACKGARPNHVGVVIAGHKRAGRIEERDGGFTPRGQWRGLKMPPSEINGATPTPGNDPAAPHYSTEFSRVKRRGWWFRHTLWVLVENNVG